MDNDQTYYVCSKLYQASCHALGETQAGVPFRDPNEGIRFYCRVPAMKALKGHLDRSPL